MVFWLAWRLPRVGLSKVAPDGRRAVNGVQTMGIYGAMLTAVTGLNAQSYALENISGNIANSQTPGYKRLDTTFKDLVPEAPQDRQAAGSVGAFSRATNTIFGDTTETGIDTHLAISGDGFFAVRDRTAYSGGEPVFGGQELYTRRGDFEVDANGYLVNKAGNYLLGLTVDPTTGAVNGSSPSPIKISTSQVPAQATTTIKYVANLPTVPQTPAYSDTVANSELMNTVAYDVATNPNGFTSGTGAIVPTIAANETTRFLNQSLTGPAVTVYDTLGTPTTLQTRWSKTNSVANGGTDTWSLYYQNNPTATGATTQWSRISNFAFNTNGALTSANMVQIPTTTINGVTFGPITFDVSGGLTQYADISGQTKESFKSQDGFTAGKLTDLSVSQDGVLSIAYSNGQVLPAYQISVAQFSAANALKRLDGGTFSQTLESGSALAGLNGSKMQSGRLEGSNSDIADEFSKMIVTQQAYSANTRVITTSQQMLQDVLNIIR
jgi:flagellar hook protein FlgE